MSTAAVGAPDARRRASASIACFSALALVATAILVALVLLDGQPRVGGADPRRLRPRHRLSESGIQLHRVVAALPDARRGGRPARRADRDRGHRAGGRAGRGARSRNFGGAIAPLGPSLLIGAFVFGIGMQLANGCGSGTLYTVGGGSGRMLIALSVLRRSAACSAACRCRRSSRSAASIRCWRRTISAPGADWRRRWRASRWLPV